MDLVRPVLEADLLLLYFEELEFSLLFELVCGPAAAHTAEGAQHVPTPYFLPPPLEGRLFFLYYFLALQQVQVAALEIPYLESFLPSLLQQLCLCKPVLP